MAIKKIIKYTAYVATSIDGRIARDNNSGTEWTSKEDWDFFQKSLAKMDAVVVGHNTYKIAEAQLKKRNVIVITSKADKLKSSGSITFLNPEKSNLKKFIESKQYGNVGIIGGPRVYDLCLENHMFNEIFVTIEPYIFTDGVPMFSSSKFKKYKFDLNSVKKLNKKGTILLHYKYGN